MTAPVRVKKWGNRLAVVIPSRFARERKIGVGTIVDLEPVRVLQTGRRRYRLSELLAGYKRRHRHEEWDRGGTAGKEVW